LFELRRRTSALGAPHHGPIGPGPRLAQPASPRSELPRFTRWGASAMLSSQLERGASLLIARRARAEPALSPVALLEAGRPRASHPARRTASCGGRRACCSARCRALAGGERPRYRELIAAEKEDDERCCVPDAAQQATAPSFVRAHVVFSDAVISTIPSSPSTSAGGCGRRRPPDILPS